MSRKLKRMKQLSELIAKNLSKEELIELAELIDEDIAGTFSMCIQHECSKMAPELYNNLDN